MVAEAAAPPRKLIPWTIQGKPVQLDGPSEWARCEASFVYFLYYVRINGKDQETGQPARIEMERWDYLIEVASDWERGGNWIEGKGRQLGYSWLVAAYALWTITFKDFATVLLLSIGEREATDLADKSEFIYNNLPGFLKLEKKRKNNERFELWQDREHGVFSEMRSLPSTKTAGSGFTAMLVITDEWAKHPFAAENFAAWKAAIADGAGQHIALSTGYGPAAMFAQYFEEACPTKDEEGMPLPDPTRPGPNGYRARFKPWSARPDRGREWYERERASYNNEGKGLQRFIRENPSTVKEMFSSTAALVYSYQSGQVAKPPPREWAQQPIRVGAVDPGQGDNAAITVTGYHPADPTNGGLPLAHAYDEWVHEGTTPVEPILEYLKAWHQLAPFHLVLVDHNEGTLLATLQAAGLPAVSANQEKGIGLGVVESALLARTFTHSPHMTQIRREFNTYRYPERSIAGEAETVTATPRDHHADVLDTIRWQLVAISQNHPYLQMTLKQHSERQLLAEAYGIITAGEVLHVGVAVGRSDPLVEADKLFAKTARPPTYDGIDWRLPKTTGPPTGASAAPHRAPMRLSTGRRR